MPNDEPNQNTLADFDMLLDGGRNARYLGMLPPLSFVDRRNPDAAIYLRRRQFTRNPVQGRSALQRMDLQPAPQMPWRAAPVNHETSMLKQNVKN